MPRSLRRRFRAAAPRGTCRPPRCSRGRAPARPRGAEADVSWLLLAGDAEPGKLVGLRGLVGRLVQGRLRLGIALGVRPGVPLPGGRGRPFLESALECDEEVVAVR